MMVAQSRLRALLHYDPHTGVFRWRIPHGRWGRIPAGTIAGTVYRPKVGKSDYLAVRLDDRTYGLHRLAWLYMTGNWPTMIDHADMDGTNNRWSNLREATKGENMQNRRPQTNSVSRRKGVRQLPSGSWQAYVCINRRSKHLGVFNTAEEASAAYLMASRKRYGQFARA
jgi:hypothetical protein